jgi:hypothetical protein
MIFCKIQQLDYTLAHTQCQVHLAALRLSLAAALAFLSFLTGSFLAFNMAIVP